MPFIGKCGHCGKVCGFKLKECKKCIGNLHSGCVDSEGGNKTKSGGFNKTYNFCGLKRHKEAGCFKNFPEKSQSWYKEKIVKTKPSLI